MKRIYPIKKKLSFRENIQLTLPMMYDDFMSNKDRVINHPRRKTELHKMRIAGKPLRYAMEYAETAFGAEFKRCLDEIKIVIELIGEIHDTDVLIPELGSHLAEIRRYNITLINTKERLSTKGTRQLITEQKVKRAKMYDEFCTIIIRWINEDFRLRLVSSINTPSYNLAIVKPKAG